MVTFLKGLTNPLSRVIAKWLQETMAKQLPRRTKRLIFVAALTARLEDAETLSDATLVKLNDVLKLSKNESALKLPAYLRNVIWRGRGIEDLESLMGDHIDIAERTKSIIPEWLHYARSSDMVSDAMVVKTLIDGKWSEEAIRTSKMHRRAGPIGHTLRS